MGSPEIRVEAESGATLLVRLVLPGERYGTDDRLVNAGPGAVVDVAQPRGSHRLHVAAYQPEYVRDCCTRLQSFVPGDHASFRLGRDACRRLVAWLDDPHGAAETFTALLIGDEDRCNRTALILRRLGLETNVTHDAMQGVARASALLPSLVLVDADGLTRLTPAQVVAQLRGSEARHVPVIVTGGDTAALAALRADAVLGSPVGERELAEAVAELFELV